MEDHAVTEAGHVAFVANDPYLLPVMVAMTSALRNLRACRAVHAWVADHGLSATSWRKLQQVVMRSPRGGIELHRLRMSRSEVDHLGRGRHQTTAPYLKLLLVDLLPEDVTTVLVLDGDIVVRRDISALTRVDFGEAALAGVRDAGIATAASPRCSAARAPGDLGQRPYFNSGAIALNLPCWRTRSLTEQALAYAERHGPLALVDQDALNAVAGPWHELPLSYNLQTFALDTVSRQLVQAEATAPAPALSDLRTAAVVHYAGPYKPWHTGYPGVGGGLWHEAARAAGVL